MKLQLTAPHWLIVGIGLIGTIAPNVATSFPTLAPICAEITQLTPLVLTALGVLTGSAMTVSAPPAAK